MSHEWQLQLDDDGMRFMPPPGFPGDDQPQSRSHRDSSAVRDVSHHLRLAAGNLRSFENRIPTHGSPRTCGLRAVPHERELQLDDDCVCVVPLEGFSGNYGSESHRGGTSSAVRSLSFDLSMAAGDLRSFQDWISTDRGTCWRSVRAMPYERKLQSEQHDLCQLPLEGFSEHK